MLLIVDCGSQYTQSIARRFRDLGVESEVVDCADAVNARLLQACRGIVLSGGPQSVREVDAPRIPAAYLDCSLPTLALCYGMQYVVREMGGEVQTSSAQYGATEVALRTCNEAALDALPRSCSVWMSHGDTVVRAPPGFDVLAQSSDGTIAGLWSAERRLCALQFHPEVEHTEDGQSFLAAFCALCAETTALDKVVAVPALVEMLGNVRECVGERRVLVAVSGGVDSTTLAVLLERAGVRSLPVFIDNGLLREGEAHEVAESLRERCGLSDLLVVDAQAEFLSALEDVCDPDAKRVVIGKCFADVLSRIARERSIEILAQGTLASDVIESGHAGKGSHTIKRHHNVGAMPADFALEILEPFRPLYKDQVRALAAELGLPMSVTWRHPCPGPALAIRVSGAVTREKLALVRACDAVFVDELRKRDLYDKCAQAFAILLDVRAVGVRGDARSYEAVVCLRAVTTRDYMTADWYDFDKRDLQAISSRILNECRVGRVLYDVTQKPPGTIEWE